MITIDMYKNVYSYTQYMIKKIRRQELVIKNTPSGPNPSKQTPKVTEQSKRTKKVKENLNI